MSTELTLDQIAHCVREAHVAYCLDKYSSFEVALARKIEAALASVEPVKEADVSDAEIDALALEHDGVLWQLPAFTYQWRFSEESLRYFARAIRALRGGTP